MKAKEILSKGMRMVSTVPNNNKGVPVHPVKKNAPSNVIKKVLGEKTGGNLLSKLKSK